MKIEDCKIGMDVKCISDGLSKIKKGEELVIKKVIKSHNHIVFKDIDGLFSPFYFEPLFEVGEKVIYMNYFGEKFNAEIAGIANKKDYKGNKYAISYIAINDELFNKFTSKKRLYKLRKKDDLKKGDKFEGSSGNIYEVIASGYDERENMLYYFCKKDNQITIVSKDSVKEVIINERK